VRSSNTGPKDPAVVLERAAKTEDFDRPIVLCPVTVPHFVGDGEAYPIVREIVGALPSGSRVVLGHLTEDLDPGNARAVQRTYTERGFTSVPRTRARSPRTTGAPAPSSGSATRASTT
jgi:hypothetical protein